MVESEVFVGARVVRSKGDYVVGRTGEVVGVDNDKKRAQVAWDEESKTWVSFSVIESLLKPFKIETGKSKTRTGFVVNFKKYVPLSSW